MYDETSSCVLRWNRSAAVTTAASTATTPQSTSVRLRPRNRLLKELDSGRAAVGVAEDELHEPFAGDEVRRPRPRAELEAGLPQRAAHHECLERACGNPDALRPDDRGRPRDAKDGEVTTGVL